MSFIVDVSNEARSRIDHFYQWIAERSPQGADTWYRELYLTLDRLRNATDVPGSTAPDSIFFDEIQVRQVVFKTRKGNPYRILFAVEATRITVLTVRGPGEDYFTQ